MRCFVYFDVPEFRCLKNNVGCCSLSAPMCLYRSTELQSTAKRNKICNNLYIAQTFNRTGWGLLQPFQSSLRSYNQIKARQNTFQGSLLRPGKRMPKLKTVTKGIYLVTPQDMANRKTLPPDNDTGLIPDNQAGLRPRGSKDELASEQSITSYSTDSISEDEDDIKSVAIVGRPTKDEERRWKHDDYPHARFISSQSGIGDMGWQTTSRRRFFWHCRSLGEGQH